VRKRKTRERRWRKGDLKQVVKVMVKRYLKQVVKVMVKLMWLCISM
jgi:hypothetical protein